ncbi:MAG: fumarylacetoacetate hydrolase family protein [Chloroflexota bacterium]|nr:fumarylacetoacetate hydrolase family protein [Chloroflexota bacterium]
MRLCTYERHGKIGVGVEAGGEVHATTDTDMLDLIRDGEAGLERARAAANGPAVTVDRMLAPLLRPGKTFGSGVNYKAHGEEEGTHAVLPVEPRIDFIKLPNTVIGPGEPIVIPTADRVIIRPDGYQVDYEVEFGVVIGKRAKNVSQADALDYVFGYTVFNDVSARGVQFGPGKWLQADLGKNFDTFCPMGPVIVTRDEIPDLARAHITATVNGEPRQDAYLSQQIFPIPVVIEWISSIITLEPGDCLMTGTPAGIGTFRDPPLFLKPGDVVTVAEDTIGELTNPVVAG